MERWRAVYSTAKCEPSSCDLLSRTLMSDRPKKGVGLGSGLFGYVVSRVLGCSGRITRYSEKARRQAFDLRNPAHGFQVDGWWRSRVFATRGLELVFAN